LHCRFSLTIVFFVCVIAAEAAVAPFQSYDSPHNAPSLLLVPVAAAVDITSAARRVIIIDKSVMNLDPAVYLADRLFQAFLMYNYKLVWCECFDNEHQLDHALKHMIHGWCAAMKVSFIHHNDFINQMVEASLTDVVSATKLWLVGFVQKNHAFRAIQSGEAQRPSAGMVAAVPSSPPLLVSLANGKRRYPAATDGSKRKGAASTTTSTKNTSKAAAVGVKKLQAKTPRKTSKKLGKQGAAAAAAAASILIPPLPTTTTDDALPKFNDVDGIDGAPLSGQPSSLLVRPSGAVAAIMPASKHETGDEDTGGLSLEPLDKDGDLQHLDFSDEAEYLDFLILPGGDGENQPRVPATAQDAPAMPSLELTTSEDSDPAVYSSCDEFLNSMESY
jgi:hypothetical protein